MTKYILFLSILFSVKITAQNLYFPPLIGQNWDTKPPNELGWCSQYEAELLSLLEAENSKAFILLKDGKIVYE